MHGEKNKRKKASGVLPKSALRKRISMDLQYTFTTILKTLCSPLRLKLSIIATVIQKLFVTPFLLKKIIKPIEIII